MQYADPTKLRAYFFANMYLSQIQQGIQAAHVVTKMFVQTRHDNSPYPMPGGNDPYNILHAWGRDGVTKILLNGGYQSNLADVHSIFEFICPRLGLPFAKFHEEEAALNGALTSVGIVVPEEVYAGVATSTWLDPVGGMFALASNFPDRVPPTDPRSPTVQDILFLVSRLPDRPMTDSAGQEILRALLYATLKTGRLA